MTFQEWINFLQQNYGFGSLDQMRHFTQSFFNDYIDLFEYSDLEDIEWTEEEDEEE